MTSQAVTGMPPGAVDTHVHVLDPLRFPYDAAAGYKPVAAETATARQLGALLDAHGVDRVVIVDPTSGYDGDPSCLLDALLVLGERARGVLRWSPRRPPLDRNGLMAMRRRGIAGVRVDCVADGVERLATPEFEALARHVAELDLVLDVQCEREQLLPVARTLARLPGRNVIDHLGRPDVSLGVDAAGFRALLDLSERGKTFVKLSAPMRMSQHADWRDVDPFIRALYEAGGPDALVWGSDWPFMRSQVRIDYAPLLSALERWIPDREHRRRVLVDTPDRLFFR